MNSTETYQEVTTDVRDERLDFFEKYMCCAVSFIENLTAESLNVAQQEFEAYMSGEITFVSVWESALVACERMHQLCEHLSLLKNLSQRTTTVQEDTKKLIEDILKFS